MTAADWLSDDCSGCLKSSMESINLPWSGMHLAACSRKSEYDILIVKEFFFFPYMKTNLRVGGCWHRLWGSAS